jgi:hypothetical protein
MRSLPLLASLSVFGVFGQEQQPQESPLDDNTPWHEQPLPTNDTQFNLKPSVVETLSQFMLQSTDQNGDGFLTQDEMNDMLNRGKQAGILPPTAFIDIQKFGSSSDGKLTLQELNSTLSTFFQQTYKQSLENMASAFNTTEAPPPINTVNATALLWQFSRRLKCPNETQVRFQWRRFKNCIVRGQCDNELECQAPAASTELVKRQDLAMQKLKKNARARMIWSIIGLVVTIPLALVVLYFTFLLFLGIFSVFVAPLKALLSLVGAVALGFAFVALLYIIVYLGLSVAKANFVMKRIAQRQKNVSERQASSTATATASESLLPSSTLAEAMSATPAPTPSP